MLQIITGIGLGLDILVCVFFAFRLSVLLKKDATNLFLRYFTGFFWAFNLFLFFTILYIPNLIVPANSVLLNYFFSAGFLALYIVSAFAIRIIWTVFLPAKDNRLVFWLMIFSGIISAIVLILSGPFLRVIEGRYMLQLNPYVMSVIGFPVGATFLSASYLFISKAITQEQVRFRYLMFGVAFVVWIVGGVLHPLASNIAISILADLLVAIGFFVSFIALIRDTK